MIMLAGILNAMGQGSGSPSIQATSIKTLGRERAGVVSSTCYIGQDIGNAIAPTLGGLVAERFGTGTMFSGYAALLLISGCSIFYIKNKYEERKYGVTNIGAS